MTFTGRASVTTPVEQPFTQGPTSVAELPADMRYQQSDLTPAELATKYSDSVYANPNYVPSLQEFGELGNLARDIKVDPQVGFYNNEGDFVERERTATGPNGKMDVTQAERLKEMADPKYWLQDEHTEALFMEAADVMSMDTPQSQDAKEAAAQKEQEESTLLLAERLAEGLVPDTSKLDAVSLRRLAELSRQARRDLDVQGVDYKALLAQRHFGFGGAPVRPESLAEEPTGEIKGDHENYTAKGVVKMPWATEPVAAEQPQEVVAPPKELEYALVAGEGWRHFRKFASKVGKAALAATLFFGAMVPSTANAAPEQVTPPTAKVEQYYRTSGSRSRQLSNFDEKPELSEPKPRPRPRSRRRVPAAA